MWSYYRPPTFYTQSAWRLVCSPQGNNSYCQNKQNIVVFVPFFLILVQINGFQTRAFVLCLPYLLWILFAKPEIHRWMSLFNHQFRIQLIVSRDMINFISQTHKSSTNLVIQCKCFPLNDFVTIYPIQTHTNQM